VKAARPGLQDRRGVDVADAEVIQVRYELARRLEREATVELEAVRGAWDMTRVDQLVDQC